MARPRKAAAAKPQTTAQMLGSLLKSARDIMRKDKGLNGDLDRLPMLTWIMFLKFLDDLERQREDDAVLAGKRFRPAIEQPYRWRDWAADRNGITGDELLAFVNQDQCIRPDGTKGSGLFHYLRNLSSSGDEYGRREVIATVFRGVDNRMRNGYLLRDVIDKVNGIHFDASEELLTLGTLYESMLREMRDAAGDSGEFYTPRAVVRFMVKVTDPKLGERVLDPACGTGGFLVEAFDHLKGQVRTVQDRETLQQRSLFGTEPKSLPYMLCQMNLLLHGLEAPNIDAGNALRHKLSEIGVNDQVDVILTNPPFGGEEERGIQNNFPEDKRTNETALLFLQLIMRMLRRGKGKHGPARAAVVVPNGTLFGDGVCARIKEQLLRDFNLHTVVRLPNGVFAPYTSIPANLLFFDTDGPTRDIWFYEQPLPEGRKNYTKTQPMQFEEFQGCLDWWTAREPTAQAWRIDFAAEKAEAERRAEPHRQAARAAEELVGTLSAELRSLGQDLRRAATQAATRRIQDRIDDLQARLSVAQSDAAREKAAADAIYWPIYNLDRKNPNAKADLEHQPPEVLVKTIIEKERQILALMGEIEALLGAKA